MGDAPSANPHEPNFFPIVVRYHFVPCQKQANSNALRVLFQKGSWHQKYSEISLKILRQMQKTSVWKVPFFHLFVCSFWMLLSSSLNFEIAEKNHCYKKIQSMSFYSLPILEYAPSLNIFGVLLSKKEFSCQITNRWTNITWTTCPEQESWQRGLSVTLKTVALSAQAKTVRTEAPVCLQANIILSPIHLPCRRNIYQSEYNSKTHSS